MSVVAFWINHNDVSWIERTRLIFVCEFFTNSIGGWVSIKWFNPFLDSPLNALKPINNGLIKTIFIRDWSHVNFKSREGNNDADVY